MVSTRALGWLPFGWLMCCAPASPELSLVDVAAVDVAAPSGSVDAGARQYVEPVVTAPSSSAAEPGSAPSVTAATPASATASAGEHVAVEPPASASAAATATKAKIPCRSDDDCWLQGDKPIRRPAHLRGRRFRPCIDGEVSPACINGGCSFDPTRGWDC